MRAREREMRERARERESKRERERLHKSTTHTPHAHPTVWRLIPIVVKKEFLTPLAGGANLLTFADEMAKVAAQSVEKMVVDGGARTVIVPLFFGVDQIPEGEIVSNGNPMISAAARAIMASASAAVNASMVRLQETLPVAASIHTVDVRELYGNRSSLVSASADASLCFYPFSLPLSHPALSPPAHTTPTPLADQKLRYHQL